MKAQTIKPQKKVTEAVTLNQTESVIEVPKTARIATQKSPKVTSKSNPLIAKTGKTLIPQKVTLDQPGLPQNKTGPANVTTPTKQVKPVPELTPQKLQSLAKPALSQSNHKSEPVTTKTKIASHVAPPAPIIVAKPAVHEPYLTSTGVPVRSGRPSSRLAQLTVPSMAQSVASTAAKASFTQITQVTQIVPPLASSVKKDSSLANNWKSKTIDQLTDPEVMAMSDDDYMNDTQLAYFRLKLVTLKNNMLTNAGETTEHLREDTVVVPDPADRATIEEEHALELRTRDRERKLLKKIEQSIVRIDAGDYGYCDETGEPIGVGRLLARPTANLSLEAQQRRELKQKMFGD